MHRGFVTAAWISLVAAVLSAAFAVFAVVVGALVLSGRTGLPLERSWGPFSVDSAISLPVGTSTEACTPAQFARLELPGGCAAVTLDPDHPTEADLVPVGADLYGDLALEFDGGWNPYVAARLGGAAVWAGLLSLLLFQLSRFLHAGARGAAFGEVDRVRGIGLLVVAMSLLDPALDQLATKSAEGFAARGPGLMLEPTSTASLNLSTVALGLVIVLVAEVLRRGAEIEAEQELTV